MKILIADDEEGLHRAYERMLGKEHELRFVFTAEAALEVLGEGFGPEAIISDMEMPGIPGDAFCKKLRDRGDDTPFLLVSGADKREILDRGGAAGVDGILEKPISKDMLRYFLRKCVQARAVGADHGKAGSEKE